jgi:hypothetical protein
MLCPACDAGPRRRRVSSIERRDESAAGSHAVSCQESICQDRRGQRIRSAKENPCPREGGAGANFVKCTASREQGVRD